MDVAQRLGAVEGLDAGLAVPWPRGPFPDGPRGGRFLAISLSDGGLNHAVCGGSPLNRSSRSVWAREHGAQQQAIPSS